MKVTSKPRQLNAWARSDVVRAIQAKDRSGFDPDLIKDIESKRLIIAEGVLCYKKADDLSYNHFLKDVVVSDPEKLQILDMSLEEFNSEFIEHTLTA